jgi:hypothetical protein
MEIDLEACFNYVQTNALNLGKAEADVIRLEGKMKAVKAALMDASDASSAAMKEVDSYRHSAYLEVVNELAEATAKKVQLGIMIKAAFQKIECHRAQSYTTRAELRNLQ